MIMKMSFSFSMMTTLIRRSSVLNCLSEKSLHPLAKVVETTISLSFKKQTKKVEVATDLFIIRSAVGSINQSMYHRAYLRN